MCDCYDAYCKICNKEIPMHIGGFAYPRERFEFWCKDHIEQAEDNAVIFTVIKTYMCEFCKIKKGWQCAIKGPEVLKGNNLPNLGADYFITVINPTISYLLGDYANKRYRKIRDWFHTLRYKVIYKFRYHRAFERR